MVSGALTIRAHKKSKALLVSQKRFPFPKIEIWLLRILPLLCGLELLALCAALLEFPLAVAESR